MIPILMAALAARGKSKNMQGMGGVDPNAFLGERTAPMAVAPVGTGRQPINYRPGRDFTDLIYQTKMTPSIGMVGAKTGVGLLGEYLKKKYGGMGQGGQGGGNAGSSFAGKSTFGSDKTGGSWNVG